MDKDNTGRGGSKRWAGKGPAPARHIPWPEIFKHHISVLEGHHKMIDMIRKHTQEGTGNHKTIMACLERSQMALDDSKLMSRTFVPPADYRDKVPIGSSSISMYPGYSPADHEYGKAAEEYGMNWKAAQRNGATPKMEIDGPEYQVGQARIAKRKALDGGDKKEDLFHYESVLPNRKRGATGSNSTPVGANGSGTTAPLRPMFVVDAEPTPVDLPQKSHQRNKPEDSKVEPEPAAGSDKPSRPKKSKTKHSNEEETEEVEREDITERVEARLREKEEKRKRKEKEKEKEKKRKRESENSALEEGQEAPAVTDAPAEEAEKPEKPKKKKSKKSKDIEAEVEAEVEAGDGEATKKKKKKNR